MAAKIVQISDFQTDNKKIGLNGLNTNELQTFIDKYEPIYVKKVLGFTLGTTFLGDITVPFTEPNTQIYKDIFNVIEDDENCIESKGMKDMLACFIYWEFVKQQPVRNMPSGNYLNQQEVATPVDPSNTQLYEIYNSGVKTAKNIQKYIKLNSEDYPDYKGKCFTVNSWAI